MIGMETDLGDPVVAAKIAKVLCRLEAATADDVGHDLIIQGECQDGVPTYGSCEAVLAEGGVLMTRRWKNDKAKALNFTLNRLTKLLLFEHYTGTIACTVRVKNKIADPLFVNFPDGFNFKGLTDDYNWHMVVVCHIDPRAILPEHTQLIGGPERLVPLPFTTEVSGKSIRALCENIDERLAGYEAAYGSRVRCPLGDVEKVLTRAENLRSWRYL
jgi:hypothetical protein